MARGNQRELARQKNMKKTQEINKGKRKEDSLTASQRKQRDSEIMQQKQKAAKRKMKTRVTQEHPRPQHSHENVELRGTGQR
ncbi:PREDICTED: small EDRK-rich factor 1-like [Elephantulus edwardii]|uniref:small EDRK-rich factor 1-like n=1 Tax=Elephantulus edwardii TaxID=28737 RepID=UPI0003F0A558|nr:PREDICTED: small EDRK-rich factor 1-like [Elephantulus edwardii]